MFLLALLLACLLTVRLFGGRLSALAAVRLRGTWLLWVALAGQILITTVAPQGAAAPRAAAHIATYLVAGAFLVANRRLPGVAAMGAGGGLNFAAITANDGVMPASASALRTAGIATDPAHFVNSGVVADPRLAFLGDVFALPHWVPLANVFSLGDVVLLAGGVYALYRLCGCRAPWRGRAAASPRLDAQSRT